jgi:uncharacterized protein YjbJ (UPF0337 family)/sporulation protein YlmC with PRC-barrel domain
MNRNQVKGHANEAKGKVKEVAGEVTGDKSTEYEGRAEKYAGKAEANYGDLKRDAKESNEISYSRTQSKSSYDAADDRQNGACLLSATTITGDEVCNLRDEDLGTIQDIMLDINEGKIRYAVLASGGFLGMGDRLFAVPWKALKQDKENHRFVLDVDAERLKKAPGFDKNHWPNMADPTWNSSVESYYAG